VQFMVEAKHFYLLQVRVLSFGPTEPPIIWVPGVLSEEVKWPLDGARTHVDLVLRLRMSGAVPPLPHTPT
jgi:hypothetical protein